MNDSGGVDTPLFYAMIKLNWYSDHKTLVGFQDVISNTSVFS